MIKLNQVSVLSMLLLILSVSCQMKPQHSSVLHASESSSVLYGAVIDGQGFPLPDTKITLYYHDKSTKECTTDTNGRFSMYGLLPGNDLQLLVYNGFYPEYRKKHINLSPFTSTQVYVMLLNESVVNFDAKTTMIDYKTTGGQTIIWHSDPRDSASVSSR